MTLVIQPGAVMPEWARGYHARRVVGGSSRVHLAPQGEPEAALCGLVTGYWALGWESEFAWTLCHKCAKVAATRAQQ